MNRKTLIVGLLMLSTPLRSFADPATDLERCKTLGEAAIQAQKAQIDIRDLQIKQSKDIIELQNKEIVVLKSDSLFKSPWLWLTVGAVVGAYLKSN